MTLTSRKPFRLLLSLSLPLLTLTAFWLTVASAQAMGNTPIPPLVAEFSKTVQNGQADVVRGVYVQNVLSLPVVAQPVSDPGFVSGAADELTQFGLAAEYGNIGLLAHNNLAGNLFSQLAVGQEVYLVYGDGHIEIFVITEVLKYQALQPASPYSSFQNLDQDKTLTADQMFQRVYLGARHLTFQTCIAASGDASWGRLFVIAVPK